MDETYFRHRMEVEHCVRGDGEEIRNFLHRIKQIVDKGWPGDMEGIAEADRAAERQAQRRERRQWYIEYTLRGLRPRYLQRKAQEYLMEHPNATWNDFSTRTFQRDVSYQVSSNFLNDEEQTKVQLASLGQEMKNFRSQLHEHRVNALENSRQPDPNQKGRQNATRFCNYCRTNGHTQNWCRRRMQDEGIRRVQYDMSFKRNVAPIWDCGTSRFNRESQNDQNSDRPPDWTYGNNPTNGLLTTEGEVWQDGSNELILNESRFISRADGMGFNMAQISSTGESDAEMSDPLPLGYWRLQSLLYNFFLYPFQTFFTLILLNSFSLLLLINLRSILCIQSTIIRLRLEDQSIASVSQNTSVLWREMREVRTLCSGHSKNQAELTHCCKLYP